MRTAARYLLLGVLTGLLAPVGLFAFGTLTDRQFDPLELFAIMAVGGVLTFATAGWMIGRRDEALRALATIDGLTGIPNRRAFDERLALETARTARHAVPLALVMVDLDHFKKFNDRYGHKAGDEVLRRVSALSLIHI